MPAVAKQGVATLHFDVAAQAAEYSTEVVTVDGSPNPKGGSWKLLSHPFTGLVPFASLANDRLFVFCYQSPNGWVSLDGENWTAVVASFTPSAGRYHKISYGNGIYVGVCDNNSYITSSDGINWTTRTFPFSRACENIIFGSGVFVATTVFSISIFVSTNGINWTSYTKNTSSTILSVSYTAGRFFILTNGGVNEYSYDGMVWATFTISFSIGNSTVSGTSNLLSIGGSYTNSIGYSYDGQTWFTTTTPVNDQFNTVYVNGVFFGIGQSGQNVVTSADCLTWQEAPAIQKAGASYIQALAFGSSIFCLEPSTTGKLAKLSMERVVSTVQTLKTPVYPVVGSNIATVTVTGQSGLLITDAIDCWIQASDSTADHNAYEHKIAPIKLAITNVVAGVGFDIVGLSEHRLDGDFKVRWVWSR